MQSTNSLTRSKNEAIWTTGERSALITHERLDQRIAAHAPIFGRRWMSSLILSDSSTVLAREISTSPPDPSTVLSLLKSCVQTHGYLPATLTVAQPPRFDALETSALLARFGVKVIWQAHKIDTRTHARVSAKGYRKNQP